MKRLLSLILILMPFLLCAQQEVNDYVIVSDVVIKGNTVTKESIILRELTFSVGDTLDVVRWEEEKKISHENILNTTLFNFVTFEEKTDVANDKGVVLQKDGICGSILMWHIPTVTSMLGMRLAISRASVMDSK